jgi:hypothetical protein
MKWLFSRPLDLAVFLGTALVALALVPLGSGEGSEWTWVTGVLLVDVAHVWSTAFVVYLDPAELRRRRAYWIVPLAAWAAGVLVYAAAGEATFWRALAYLAVFHFIRQQWGWVALYRARVGETGGRALDMAAVYAATLYPLLYWHANLPREFAWFMPGDFAAVPELFATIAAPLHAGILALWAARALPGWLRGRPLNPGKDIIVVTTAACWYVGIVLTNSDHAFTVTNVFLHGVPYLALVFIVARARPGGLGGHIVSAGPLLFLATVWALAYAEELVWDRAVWHERGWLFGGPLELADWHLVLVPLLAVPQLTHYILDGFIWRRRGNPRVAAALRLGR